MTRAPKAGRRPADQAGGRQAIWAALKQQPGAFTVADIAAGAKCNRKTVLDYLNSLTAGGYLEHVPAPPGRPGSWSLARDVGHHAPRVRRDGSTVTQGEATEQMWRSMCALKDFSYRDLIETASIEIAEATAKDYCKHLLAAGYMRVLSKADPWRGRIARYRLVRNNGPKPPQIQRVKRVYDPNSREVFLPEGQS